MNSDLYSAAQIAVRDCIGLKKNEKVLIVTDEPMRTLAYALWDVVKEFGNEALLVEMPPRQSNGAEPPEDVASLMKLADVVLCPTSKSLTHTEARREACAKGARIATLPNVSEEIMIRCMNADYHRIAERTDRLCRMMEETSVIRVTSPAGTDITLPIMGRKAFASTGLIRTKGQWGNLPTGEAYLAPLEGKSDGVFVVDGSFALIGLVNQPIKITVEQGYATAISGGKEAEQLMRMLEPHGKDARNIAEFGIGTNDKAILSGRIIEDEKVMGTIHIALGDNKSMGGSIGVSSHVDGLIKEPSVWFDNLAIMERGKFIVEV